MTCTEATRPVRGPRTLAAPPVRLVKASFPRPIATFRAPSELAETATIISHHSTPLRVGANARDNEPRDTQNSWNHQPTARTCRSKNSHTSFELTPRADFSRCFCVRM